MILTKVQHTFQQRSGTTMAAIRRYRAERHSTLLPKAWILSSGNPMDDLRTTRLAQTLGIDYDTKQASRTWLLPTAHRHLTNLRTIFHAAPSGPLHYVRETTGNDLPSIAIAASAETLPALLEIKHRTQNQTVAVFMGLPDTKLSKIDVLVLSRLDQMKLRHLGPARANLENSVSTMLPISGATAMEPVGDKQEGGSSLAVCIGSGIEPSGFQLLSQDIDMLAEGLMHVPRPTTIRILLSSAMHRGIKSMVESRLIGKLQAPHADSNGTEYSPMAIEVLDYALPGQPSPDGVLATASRVVATADDIPSVALAVALRRPVYIAGEERTSHVLRNYYRVLDTSNLVRRFYPNGSRYSYMLLSDITGEIDEFSAIRDHEPWAAYDAQAELDTVAAFVRQRYSMLG
ncbi:hypothetical protein GGF37_004077 [Kickxella alabastrina]|nr:hypothetical protein GGF37_004077 [Kickxella alabastrina]